MSHSAEKCKRGTLRDLLTYIQLQNMKKLRKKSHSAEKKSKGGTLLVPSGFVGYLEKVKNEGGGTFGLSLPWRDLALGGFRIVSKKWWTD